MDKSRHIPINLHPLARALGRRAAVAGAIVLACLTGCAKDLHSPESALNPAGPEAHRVSSLMWIFIGVCVVVYAGVLVALLGALFHRRRGQAALAPPDQPIEPDPTGEGRLWTVVSTCIVLTVLTLFALLIGDFSTGRALHVMTESKDPLRVEVTGHQWWWEVNYADWPDRFGERYPSNTFITANEIHVPVDPAHPVTVELRLHSADVIHSFWVPSVQGKKDLIPGHDTNLSFQIDKPGTYWGECAEYCGYQHAQMRLAVVAEPVEQFQAWLEKQRAPAAADPGGDVPRRGRDVFMHSTCPMCHAIGGTEARSRVGPDLTHVASRLIIAGGALPNRPGHLAGWIANAQASKPGARMPPNSLSPEDLRALLEYVETLK